VTLPVAAKGYAVKREELKDQKLKEAGNMDVPDAHFLRTCWYW